MSETRRVERDPGLYFDVPEAEYHLDPAFSQSQAKVLLVSPAKYKWQLEHPEERVSTAALDLGSVAHAKVLGVGTGVAVIPDAYLASNGAATTTKAKTFVAEAKAAGLIPIKAADMAEVDAMAKAIEEHPEASELLSLDGRPEVSMWWDDPGTGIRCRGRVDWLATTGTTWINVDYKSTADAGPNAFARSAAEYGYHTQAGAYELALRTLGHDLVTTKLIVQEKKRPYFVAVYTFAEWDINLGLDRWFEALRLLQHCRETGEWPGYAGGDLVLPPWA